MDSNTTHTAMVNVADLVYTEDIQQTATVEAIREAMGCDPDDLYWDEIPAIIIDGEYNILDGHHRAAAAAETLGVWRAIVVDRSAWDAIVESDGHTGAIRWAADEIGDFVTWGAAK